MEVDDERRRVRAWDEEGDEGDDEGSARLAWERDYERTWEVVQEDATGALDTHSLLHTQQRLRRAEREQLGAGGGAGAGGRAVRRGMQRHLFLVVDLSQAMDDAHDMKPSRLAVTLKIAESFIREYFEQNPIAQLGIVVMRDGAAEKLSELGGNPARHIGVLKDKAHVPKYGSREIVVLFAGLATCDPTDIKSTISKLKKDSIRCSIVGLSAEIHICRVLAESTDGTYGVALHEGHYRQLVFAHVSPPPAQPQQVAASLIRMGFPTRKRDHFPSFCSCHKSLRREGYVCPQCGAKCCELPMECPVCGLTLVSSCHLARSYHHLFPLPLFQAVPLAPTEEVACFGCRRRVKGSATTGGAEVYACPRCARRFCYECDVFAHDLLHTCAGCEVRP